MKKILLSFFKVLIFIAPANVLAQADFSASSYTICGQGTVTLSDLSVNSPTAWLWSVSPSSGAIIASASSQNTSVIFSLAGSYSIQLIASNATSADTVSKIINVYNLPVAVVTAQGPTAFCPGGSVQLNSSAAVSYLWNNSEITQNITVNQSGNYYVSVTDANGCSDVSDTISVMADSVVNPGICMVTVDGGSVNNIIYWDRSAGMHVDSFIVYREVSTSIYKRIGAVSNDSLGQFIDTSRSVGPANGDPNIASYRYKIQAKDSCGNASPMSPYHNTIYIVDDGSGQFSWSIPYTIEGGANPVSNYVLLCDTANVDVWGPVATVPGTQSSAVDPGFPTHGAIANWRVKTAWSITCDPDSRATVNTTRSNIKHGLVTDITTFSLNNSVVIYPNPAVAEVTIGLSPDVKEALITVVNVMGQTIISESFRAEGRNGSKRTFNTSEFAKGMYLVKIETSESTLIKKLVIR